MYGSEAVVGSKGFLITCLLLFSRPEVAGKEVAGKEVAVRCMFTVSVNKVLIMLLTLSRFIGVDQCLSAQTLALKGRTPSPDISCL